MIRDALRRRLGIHEEVLPFDMFDRERTRAEAEAARKLTRLYHVGQERIWDGREVLAELVERHGGIRIDPDLRVPLATVFAVILWGELAAWKVSAEMAAHIEPLEPKLAATSQAHDEARHFYVMHDYLELLGAGDVPLGPATRRVIEGPLRARTLAERLLGMQLIIEPMALTLFHMVRESAIEPVLCDLLAFYERDEARHVGLGVMYLPDLLASMSPAERVRFSVWQFNEYNAQLAMFREFHPHLAALGLDVRRVVQYGRDKQVQVSAAMIEQLGHDLRLTEAFLRYFDLRIAWEFPAADVGHDPLRRARRALHAALTGPSPLGKEARAA